MLIYVYRSHCLVKLVQIMFFMFAVLWHLCFLHEVLLHGNFTINQLQMWQHSQKFKVLSMVCFCYFMKGYWMLHNFLEHHVFVFSFYFFCIFTIESYGEYGKLFWKYSRASNSEWEWSNRAKIWSIWDFMSSFISGSFLKIQSKMNEVIPDHQFPWRTLNTWQTLQYLMPSKIMTQG